MIRVCMPPGGGKSTLKQRLPKLGFSHLDKIYSNNLSYSNIFVKDGTVVIFVDDDVYELFEYTDLKIKDLKFNSKLYPDVDEVILISYDLDSADYVVGYKWPNISGDRLLFYNNYMAKFDHAPIISELNLGNLTLDASDYRIYKNL